VWLYGVDRQGTWYDLLGQISAESADGAQLYKVEADGSNPSAVFEGDVENPRLSPDGNRVALTVENGNDDYLMILNLTSGVQERITYSEDVDHFAWSSDGASIMLSRSGQVEVWSSGGLGLESTLPIDTASFLDWSTDGRYVVYVNDLSDSGPLRLYDMESQQDTLFEGNEASRPRFSPDGRFVTYEIFDAEGVHAAVRATSGPGYAILSLEEPQSRRPVWSRDGSSIYVDAILNHIVRVPVDITGSFVQTGRGRTVVSLDENYEFDVNEDGTLFILGQGLFDGSDSSAPQAAQLNVIVNWFEQVKELAPAAKQ
jgi:hypothetical protein